MSALIAWYHRIVEFLTLCSLCLGAASCKPGRPNLGIPPKFGFIVIDSAARDSFHLPLGDTLQELPVKAVSEVVRNSANAEALRHKFGAECSRFFGGEEFYVVLFVRGCASKTTTEDGDGMAAYDLTGQELGPTQAPLWGYYVHLEPLMRKPSNKN